MAEHHDSSMGGEEEAQSEDDGDRSWVIRIGKEGGDNCGKRDGNRRWLIKTLAMPAAICLVPLLFELISHMHDERENQFRLYTELLSKREDADMAVRQGIFNKVFDKYLPPDAKDFETRLVGLELMASNFHESVDIGPLFRQLDRELSLQHSKRFVYAGQDPLSFCKQLHGDDWIESGVRYGFRSQNEIAVGVISVRHALIEPKQRRRKLRRKRFVQNPGAGSSGNHMLWHHSSP